MPDCNVRWKGYPHRCLPRIRVASSSGTSIRSRRAPRFVSAYKSRLRARHHVQAFGWNTEVASRANASPVSRSPVVDSIEGPRYRTQRSLVSSQALSRCGKRVAPLDGVDSGRSHRTRSYDTRVDPRKLLDRNHPAKSQSTTATTRRAASRPSPKKQCEGNSCLHLWTSRTPTQRKALDQFTKELELHLQTESLNPSLVVPSTRSVHTIEELRPYKSQFQSAGLAVTAADQLGPTCIPAKSKKDQFKMDWSDGPAHSARQQSFHSGTTVMAFTPPHEQADPHNAMSDTNCKSKNSPSTGQTIMSFTPPHEKRPPIVVPDSAPLRPPRASTKKSLPWLRKPESFDASASPSPKKKDVMAAANVRAKIETASDALLLSAGKHPMVERIGWLENELPFELQRRLQEVRRQDRDSETDGDNADAVGKCQLYKDAAIQACFDQYVNATSQTDFPDVRSAIPSEQNNIERQPSRIQKRNKSISISPKNSDTRPSRKRQQDQELQAEMANFTTAGQTEAPESSSLALGINLPNPDSDFPLLSVSKDQHSPDMGNPQASVDKGVVSKNEVSTRPQHKIGSASQESIRCTLCSREIKNTTRKPQLGVSVEPEPIYEHNAKTAFENRYEEETGPSLRSTWSQAGLARSTLECQQCAHPELCNAHLATNLEVELEEILKRYYPPEERFLQRKVIQDTMEKYAKQPPVADPVKKPPLPSRSRLRPPPTNRSTTKHNREAPTVPDAVIPQSDISSSVLTRDSSGISNQDVLRGLHVATAAACDEGVAKWIEEITGTGVRGFLADLSAYNGLGCNTLARVARRAAKRRREAVSPERTWEKRPQSGGDDGAVDYADDIRIVKAHDNATKMGCGVVDDGVDVWVKRKESGRGKGQVRDGVIATR